MSAGALVLAFAAGLLSFATPCVLPLVPGYLAAIGGVDVDALSSRESGTARRVVVASLPFIAGFTVVFVLLGAAAGALGALLASYRPELRMASGILVVAFGFALAGLLPAPWLDRSAQPGLLPARRTGSAALLGAAFAFCWSPCVGPVLASILALSSTEGAAGRSAVLLLVYSIGLAVPFLLVGAAFSRSLVAFRWLRDRYDRVRIASGVILVLLGLALFFDRLWWLNQTVDRALRVVGVDGFPSV